MPTFATGSGTGDALSTLLIYFPNTDWFKRCIMDALDLMTLEFNWTENGDVGISFAVEESEKMLQSYIFMDFNPIPIGLIHPFASATIPGGYLACDGASILTADYPELFTAIGYTFGGSGANFNVPTLINRVIIGAGDIYNVANTGGEAEVFLDVASMPSHSHNDSGHTHSIPLTVSLPAQAGVGFSADQRVPIVTDSTGIGFASLTNTGGDGAHNNLQPYQAITYCIYAGR